MLRYTISVLCLLLLLPVHAATIVQIGTTDLAKSAELIFQGEVIKSRAELHSNGNIYTFVDFLLADVLVGEAEIGSVLTLRFTGGSVDNMTLDVGATVPNIGEYGIYFVEGVNKQLINPLLGWSQGHFRITSGGAILAGNDEVVIGVEKEERNDNVGISMGIAMGINTIPRTENDTPASNTLSSTEESSVPLIFKPVSVEEFKKLIMAAGQ